MTTTASTAVRTATSADGTPIAYEQVGTGPALVLVDGAFCSRDFGPARDLAAALSDRFTVTFYDRRGRGASGDTAPYAPEREYEDLAAVVDAAGGDAFVMGQSSGGGLALQAAAAGVRMRRLATYEVPYVGRRSAKDGTRLDYVADLTARLATGKRGAAAGYFMVDMIGAPSFVPLLMRLNRTAWRQLASVEPTLVYDATLMGSFEVPADELARIDVPVLALTGGRSADEMVQAQRRVADAVRGAEHDVLAGQNHQVKPSVLAPRLAAFFTAA
jgi:pimeloyl-ACP methyl ester carboxylesterase